MGAPASVSELAFSPDGKALAVAARDAVRLWDVAEVRERLMLDVPGSPWALAFSPDGKDLAATTSVGPLRNQEHLIMICDAASGKQRAVLRGHEGMVREVKFLPDGKALASYADDKTVRLWDLSSGRQSAVLRIEPLIHCFAVSPDGRTLAAGGFSNHPMFGVIELIDTDGKTLRHREPPR